MIDGLPADVVTLALASDIDALVDAGQAAAGQLAGAAAAEQLALHLDDRVPGAQGQPEEDQGLGRPREARRLGDHAEPEDLGRRALELPRGLCVGAQAARRQRCDRRRTTSSKLYKNVPVLDTGARGSTTTFAQRGIGDVFISWENEAYLATEELGPGKFEIVDPSLSILAEPPVAVVDKVALRRGTADVARAYLEYLYSKEAQEIIAKHYYRPRDPEIAAKYAKDFPKIEMVTIADFGGWTKAQKEHFGDGGIFDKIYTN